MDEYPLDSIAKGAKEYVFTTHVTHQEQFFVHVESRTKILDDIMENLATRYMDLGPGDKVLHSTRLGGLCAAKFTDDNNWYRAKITGLPKNGLIEVQFVDYGNTDYVGQDRIKALDPDLVQFPVQSYRCALAGVSCAQGFWPPELMVQFEDVVVDKRCLAKFLGKREHDEVYLLEMYDADGRNLNLMFGAVDFKPSGALDSQAVQNGIPDSGFDEKFVVVGRKFPGTVVYVKHPGMLWCQETAYTNELLILSEELSRLHMTQAMTPIKNVAPGMICAAKFSEDEAWYRGVVQSVSHRAAQVFFVDYGNTESISLDFVCNLKPEMKRLPALALKCCMANVDSKGKEWTAKVIAKFEELVLDKEFEVKVVKKDGDVYGVTLFDIVENKDIGNQLQHFIDCNKSETPPREKVPNSQASVPFANFGSSPTAGGKAQVYLSWVESPGDFWIQSADCEAVTENLSQQLQDFYSGPQPTGPSAPGSFVVAKFSEDQMWYRGLVLKDLQDGYVQVLFIDYGNTTEILKEELKQVTPSFGQLVPLASRCSLVGVKPLRKGDASWKTDAKDFLQKLTENGCFCEVVRETESHKHVKLACNGRDVASEMVAMRVVADATAAGDAKMQVPLFHHEVRVRKSEKQKVAVTHIESPQRFWCQLMKNIPALDEMMEKLTQHYSDGGGTPVKNPILGQACIAQYSEDNAWYRATITNTSPQGIDVYFVDYGNTELSPGYAVCDPEPRFLDMPMQAVQCSLPVPGGLDHLTAAFSDTVLDKELQMEVLDALSETAIVELYDGETVVSEILKNTTGTQASPVKSGGVSQMITKPIPAGTTVSVFTSVVISPNKFFLQISGVDEDLGTLMDSIALKYVSDNPPPPVINPQAGQDCVALYSEDNHWYRGRILSVADSSSTVLFVDYGNEETVSNNDIRSLTPDLASVPVMAYQCSLNGLEESAWTSSARECFEGLVMDKELDCKFVTMSSVKLTCDGEDIMEQLVCAGYGKAISASIIINSDASGGWNELDSVSSSVTSPKKHHEPSTGFGGGRRDRGESRKFGDHCDRDSGDRHFGSGDREPETSRFGGNRSRGDSGGFGGHRNRGDGAGFGGRRGDGEAGFRGGHSERDSGFGGRRGGDSDAKFGGGRGGDGDAKFGGGRRDRKSSTDSAGSGPGELIYADPPTDPEKAVLVHMDEDGTFYLQLPSMEREILFLSKRLAGSYKGGGGPRLRETAVKGTICCAKFKEDGSMYRAQVEDVMGGTVVVRFVDYGNTAECSPSDLKFLFPDLLQYPVQAFPCKLRGWKWSLDEVKKFAEATLDKDLEVTFTSTTRPYEVDLKTPHGDLLSIMTGKAAPPAEKLSPKLGGFGKKSPPGGFGAKSPPGGFGGKLPNARSDGGFGSSTPKKHGGHALNFGQPEAGPPVPKQQLLAQKAPQGDQSAFISHVGEDGYFFLQLEKDIHEIENFSDKLVALPSDIEHPNISIGAACAAIFSEDSTWYRARIKAITGDQLKVVFVDYGNGDLISKSSIKPLSSELLKQGPLAYECQFPEIGPLSVEAQAILSEYLMEHKVLVAFSGVTPPFYVAMLASDGKDLQEIVCPSNQYRAQPVPKEVIPAGVSGIEDDGRFFIQLYKDYKAVQALQTELQLAFSEVKAEKIESPEVGMPCCLKPGGEIWQRGKILEIDEESAKVFHVDTGNKTTTEVGCLFSLPAQFLKQPPFALECRLKGVDCWTGDLREKFVEMTQGKILNATFYSTVAPYRVSLARSIELDLLGLAAPLHDSPEKSPEKKSVESTGQTSEESQLEVTEGAGNAYISHVEPNGTFYVQKIAREGALNNLADTLESLMTSAECLNAAETGDVICARFTEDEAWYRAEVESCNEEGQYGVRFLDYGNTDTVDNDRLASLPESMSLAITPAFATHCQFPGVSGDLTVTQTDKLKELVLDKPLTIDFLSEKDGVHEVEAILHGESLVKILGLQSKDDIQLDEDTEHAYISQLESDGTFYVQKVAREVALNDLADKLEIQLESPHELGNLGVDSVVCAKFTEDDAWYRAKVESNDEENQYTVRFVDYGNTDTIGTDRLAALPDSMNLSLIPPFATKCKFAGVSADLSAEQIDTLRDMVTDKVVMVSFKSEEGGVQEVDISLEGESVLKAVGFNNNAEVLQVSESAVKDLNETTDSRDEDEFADALESVQDSAEETTAKESDCDLLEDTGDIRQETAEEEPETQESQSTQHTVAILESGGQVMEGEPQVSVASGQRVRVTVSHVESPDVFFMQLDNNAGPLEELMNSLFEYCSSLPEEDSTVKDLQVGDICAALFEDESWYRVHVESVEDEGTYKIFYMDHGNTETVDPSTLRQLPEKFKQPPALALIGKLGGVSPIEGTWTQEAVQEFRGMVEEKSLLADVIEVVPDASSCVVRLLELGIPIHEELIKKGHAVAGEDLAISKSVQQTFSDNSEGQSLAKAEDVSGYLESTHLEGDDETAKQTMMSTGAHAEQKIGCVSSSLEELKEVSVFVSHSVSPSLFWCQLASATDTLSQISDKLQEAYSKPEEGDRISGSLNAGDIVVAVFTEDEQLYRSKVLTSHTTNDGSSMQEKVAVRFIDYGNESETPISQVYRIRDNLCTLPAQAICCSLDKVQPVEDSWSPEACGKFAEIVTDAELELKLVGMEQEGTALVELVISETGQTVSSVLVDAGFAKAESTEKYVGTSTKSLNSTKRGDISEMESLEITQPIMESTAVVADNTQNNVTTYSFEDAEDGVFRFIQLSRHTEYDVCISNEEGPSTFHVQLHELKPQYTSLMAEIAEHVVSDSCMDAPDFCPKPGEACLVQYCGMWHRGEVEQQESGLWNVRSVDCGWVVNVPETDLKPLPKRFVSLPAQAIPCYLAGIVSVEPEWCTDAVTFFIDCVKDAKLCMYVLENADDGKYGVYISDLNNTGSQSINRAMVDLGYAEVVPGSNIEVQIEMEKTLDTDMLNELEESFNEVSIMRYNAGCDSGNEAMTEGSENPLIDKYEESEVCKSTKNAMDKNLYHLVQISGSSHQSDDETKQTDTENSSTPAATGGKSSEFNLATAVDRIDKMGCIDPEENLSTVVEEESDETKSENEKSELASTSKMAATMGDGGDSTERKDKQDATEIPSEKDSLGPSQSKTSPTGGRPLYTWKSDRRVSTVENVSMTEENQTSLGQESPDKSSTQTVETIENGKVLKLVDQPEVPTERMLKDNVEKTIKTDDSKSLNSEGSVVGMQDSISEISGSDQLKSKCVNVSDEDQQSDVVLCSDLKDVTANDQDETQNEHEGVDSMACEQQFCEKEFDKGKNKNEIQENVAGKDEKGMAKQERVGEEKMKAEEESQKQETALSEIRVLATKGQSPVTDVGHGVNPCDISKEMECTNDKETLHSDDRSSAEKLSGSAEKQVQGENFQDRGKEAEMEDSAYEERQSQSDEQNKEQLKEIEMKGTEEKLVSVSAEKLEAIVSALKVTKEEESSNDKGTTEKEEDLGTKEEDSMEKESVMKEDSTIKKEFIEVKESVTKEEDGTERKESVTKEEYGTTKKESTEKRKELVTEKKDSTEMKETSEEKEELVTNENDSSKEEETSEEKEELVTKENDSSKEEETSEEKEELVTKENDSSKEEETTEEKKAILTKEECAEKNETTEETKESVTEKEDSTEKKEITEEEKKEIVIKEEDSAEKKELVTEEEDGTEKKKTAKEKESVTKEENCAEKKESTEERKELVSKEEGGTEEKETTEEKEKLVTKENDSSKKEETTEKKKELVTKEEVGAEKDKTTEEKKELVAKQKDSAEKKETTEEKEFVTKENNSGEKRETTEEKQEIVTKEEDIGRKKERVTEEDITEKKELVTKEGDRTEKIETTEEKQELVAKEENRTEKKETAEEEMERVTKDENSPERKGMTVEETEETNKDKDNPEGKRMAMEEKERVTVDDDSPKTKGIMEEELVTKEEDGGEGKEMTGWVMKHENSRKGKGMTGEKKEMVTKEEDSTKRIETTEEEKERAAKAEDSLERKGITDEEEETVTKEEDSTAKFSIEEKKELVSKEEENELVTTKEQDSTQQKETTEEKKDLGAKEEDSLEKEECCEEKKDLVTKEEEKELMTKEEDSTETESTEEKKVVVTQEEKKVVLTQEEKKVVVTQEEKKEFVTKEKDSTKIKESTEKETELVRRKDEKELVTKEENGAEKNETTEEKKVTKEEVSTKKKESTKEEKELVTKEEDSAEKKEAAQEKELVIKEEESTEKKSIIEEEKKFVTRKGDSPEGKESNEGEKEFVIRGKDRLAENGLMRGKDNPDRKGTTGKGKEFVVQKKESPIVKETSEEKKPVTEEIENIKVREIAVEAVERETFEVEKLLNAKEESNGEGVSADSIGGEEALSTTEKLGQESELSGKQELTVMTEYKAVNTDLEPLVSGSDTPIVKGQTELEDQNFGGRDQQTEDSAGRNAEFEAKDEQPKMSGENLKTNDGKPETLLKDPAEDLEKPTFSASSQERFLTDCEAMQNELLDYWASVGDFCNLSLNITRILKEVESECKDDMKTDSENDPICDSDGDKSRSEEVSQKLLNLHAEFSDHLTSVMGISSAVKHQVCRLQLKAGEIFDGLKCEQDIAAREDNLSSGVIVSIKTSKDDALMELDHYSNMGENSTNIPNKETQTSEVRMTSSSFQSEKLNVVSEEIGWEILHQKQRELSGALSNVASTSTREVLVEDITEKLKDLKSQAPKTEGTGNSDSHGDSLKEISSEHSSEGTSSSASPDGDTSLEQSAFVSCPEDVDSDKSAEEAQHSVRKISDAESVVVTEMVSGCKMVEGQNTVTASSMVPVSCQTLPETDNQNMIHPCERAASFCSTESVAGTVSLDTTMEDYESCTESLDRDDELSGPPTESSATFQQHAGDDDGGSNYDTSSLIFSESCAGSSVNISKLNATTTDMSTLDSASSQSSPADTLGGSTSSSQVKFSTSTHCSEVTDTSVGSGREEDLAHGKISGYIFSTDGSASDMDPFDVSALSRSEAEGEEASVSAYEGDVSHMDNAPSSDDHEEIPQKVFGDDTSDMSGDSDTGTEQNVQNPLELVAKIDGSAAGSVTSVEFSGAQASAGPLDGQAKSELLQEGDISPDPLGDRTKSESPQKEDISTGPAGDQTKSESLQKEESSTDPVGDQTKSESLHKEDTSTVPVGDQTKSESLQKEDTSTVPVGDQTKSESLQKEDTSTVPVGDQTKSESLQKEDTSTDPVDDQTKSESLQKEGTSTDPLHDQTKSESLQKEDTSTDPLHDQTKSESLQEEDTSTDPVGDQTKSESLQKEDTSTDPVGDQTKSESLQKEDTSTDPVGDQTKSESLQKEDTSTDPVGDQTKSESLQKEDTSTDPLHDQTKSESLQKEDISNDPVGDQTKSESLQKEDTSTDPVGDQTKSESLQKEDISTDPVDDQTKSESLQKEDISTDPVGDQTKSESLQKEDISTDPVGDQTKSESLQKEDTSTDPVGDQTKSESLQKEDISTDPVGDQTKSESLQKEDTSTDPVGDQTKSESLQKEDTSTDPVGNQTKSEPLQKDDVLDDQTKSKTLQKEDTSTDPLDDQIKSESLQKEDISTGPAGDQTKSEPIQKEDTTNGPVGDQTKLEPPQKEDTSTDPLHDQTKSELLQKEDTSIDPLNDQTKSEHLQKEDKTCKQETGQPTSYSHSEVITERTTGSVIEMGEKIRDEKDAAADVGDEHVAVSGTNQKVYCPEAGEPESGRGAQARDNECEKMNKDGRIETCEEKDSNDSGPPSFHEDSVEESTTQVSGVSMEPTMDAAGDASCDSTDTSKSDGDKENKPEEESKAVTDSDDNEATAAVSEA